MDPEDELLETYDDQDQPLGLMRRHEVHKLGIWHRSVSIFLFDSKGNLYLQRRSSTKDVAPGIWDVSVAEHLIPGESSLDAATRGLAEELGLSAVGLTPYPGEFRERFVSGSIRDFELQRCFHGRHDGPVQPNLSEISEVRLLSRSGLQEEFARRPDRFTPWFKNRAIDLDLFNTGWGGCHRKSSTPTDQSW